MRAARYHGPGDVRIEDVGAPPAPGPGELLLRIATAGICGSDGAEYRIGPILIRELPVTLGHEFAGEVVAVGEGAEGFAPGTLVACGAGVSCGECRPCRAGRTHLCTAYTTLGFQRDGGLAEFCLAPAAICFDAGAYGLGPHAAALAQPMAIAVHTARRGRVAAGEVALIIGAGGIGCFLTHAAVQWGATVVVADLDEGRLEIAAALGAARTVAAGRGERIDAAPDVIFEVSGSAGALAEAIALAPRGGRIVAVGLQKSAPAVDMRRVTLDELELIGTVAHAVGEDFPEALRLLAARREGWADTAPEVLPLDRLVEDGIRPIAEGRSARIKTLIDPWARAARPLETS